MKFSSRPNDQDRVQKQFDSWDPNFLSKPESKSRASQNSNPFKSPPKQITPTLEANKGRLVPLAKSDQYIEQNKVDILRDVAQVVGMNTDRAAGSRKFMYRIDKIMDDDLRHIRFGLADSMNNHPLYVPSKHTRIDDEETDQRFKKKENSIDSRLSKLKNQNFDYAQIMSTPKIQNLNQQKEKFQFVKKPEQGLNPYYFREDEKTMMNSVLVKNKDLSLDISKNYSLVLPNKKSGINADKRQDPYFPETVTWREKMLLEDEKHQIDDQREKIRHSLRANDIHRREFMYSNEPTPKNHKQIKLPTKNPNTKDKLPRSDDERVDSSPTFLNNPPLNYPIPKANRDSQKLKELMDVKQRAETNPSELTQKNKSDLLKSISDKNLRLHHENAKLDREIQLERDIRSNYYRLNQRA